MSFMQPQSESQIINSRVRSLVKSTGLPLKLFSDAAGWSATDSLDWWSNRGPNLEYKHVQSLAQFLGVSPESLLHGSLDYQLIRKRIFFGPSCLPELYSENASSYVRTSAHIIEYLSMLKGRHFTDQVLQSLNIHPLFFDNLDNKINLNFYIDLFNRLSELGLNDQEISSLACYIFLSLRETEVGEKFKSAENHPEFYSLLADNAAAFESNFEYDFQIDSKKIRIIARPTEASLFLSKKSPEEYKRLFLYRSKVFSWFPTLSALSPLALKTTKCILKGDDHTVYETTTLPPTSEDYRVKYDFQNRLKLI